MNEKKSIGCGGRKYFCHSFVLLFFAKKSKEIFGLATFYDHHSNGVFNPFLLLILANSSEIFGGHIIVFDLNP